MTTTPQTVLETELARLNDQVATCDTAGLKHRLSMNAADQKAWYANLPITRIWLEHERRAIEAELARRGVAIPEKVSGVQLGLHDALTAPETLQEA